MKFFKKSKRHLSKHKKAKPVIRKSVIKKRVLEQQKMQAFGNMVRRERNTERRAVRVKLLGLNLIKAMEWGYMRKHLHRSTKHLSREKKLEKRKEIAEIWADDMERVKHVHI